MGPETPAPPLPTTVVITPDLKLRAQEYRSALAVVDLDQVWDHGISAVDIICIDPAAAETFLTSVTSFFVLGNNTHAVKFIRPPQRIPLNGAIVTVPLEQFLPNWFNELAQNVEGTALKVIQVASTMVDYAQRFVAAYHNNHILRTSPSDPPQGLTHEIEGFFVDVDAAQKALISFLRLVISHSDQHAPHVVTIRHDFTFEIDGVVRDLRLRQKRVLCVLALLRERRHFSQREFMMLYSNDNDPTRQAVSNNLGTLCSVLPRLDWDSDGGLCRVDALTIDSQVPDEELTVFLRDAATANTAEHRPSEIDEEI